MELVSPISVASVRMSNWLETTRVNRLCLLIELEMRIMNEIIIVFLVIGLFVLSTYLFVIEPRSKYHDSHDL
jgi:hypothetical protein